jgi:hypothetical protein
MSTRDDTPRLPEELRSAIARESGPVRPLRSPWVRALPVALLLAGLLVVLSRVPDFVVFWDDAPATVAWLWSLCFAQALVGLALIALSLREAVPGRAIPSSAVAGVFAGAFALQGVLAWLTHGVATGPAYDASMFWAGMSCARTEMLLGLPALVVTIWLAFRAYPVRPARAGLLGGLGAGLFADGVQHLSCPMSDLRHVLVWHVAGMLGLALVGAATGALAARFRR